MTAFSISIHRENVNKAFTVVIITPHKGAHIAVMHIQYLDRDVNTVFPFAL